MEVGHILEKSAACSESWKIGVGDTGTIVRRRIRETNPCVLPKATGARTNEMRSEFDDVAVRSPMRLSGFQGSPPSMVRVRLMPHNAWLGGATSYWQMPCGLRRIAMLSDKLVEVYAR